jgi:hypothetical protein
MRSDTENLPIDQPARCFLRSESRNGLPGTGRTLVLFFAALALLACGSTSSARAETMSYSIGISSSYDMLTNPSSAAARQEVAGQSAHVFWVCSDAPVVDITNTGSASITDLTLTLKVPYDVIEALKVMSPNSGATPVGPFASNVYGGPSTSLEIAIPGGLATGKSLIFALELGPTLGYSSPTWNPGYSNGLFDSADAGLNAEISVTYSSPGDAPTTLYSTLPPLATFDVTDAVTTCCDLTTTVGTTSPPQTGPTVPEPSSIVSLAGMGFLGIVLCFRHHRKSAADK